MAAITTEQNESNHNHDEEKENKCCILEEEVPTSDEERLNIIRMRQIIDEFNSEMEVAQRRVVKQPEIPMIEIQFQTHETKALIDIGAQITTMTREFYRQLKESDEPMELLPIKRFVLDSYERHFPSKVRQ